MSPDPHTATEVPGAATALPSQRAAAAALPSVPGMVVLGVLGHGAQSTVYRARRVADDGADEGDDGGVEYAVKVLHTAVDASDLRREAAMLTVVDHPGLVAFHEVGETDGRPYLVMDLVAGTSLGEILAGGPLAPATAVRLVCDIAGQLAAMHRRGLVHRDVKPDNIVVTDDGDGRLVDYGLATRQHVSGHGRPGGGGSGGDGSDLAVGTLVYAAPEQSGMIRRVVDGRADLYSLGVVMFECLAGRPPFVTDDLGELLRLHATVPAPDLREFVPTIPAGAATVVATLLAKDPDDRYRDADRLFVDLSRLRRDLAADIPPGASAPTARTGLDGSALTGRDGELSLLKGQWALARAGAGRACAMRGPSGVGKSRLAAELAVVVAAQDRPVLRTGCAREDPVPLAPVREAVDRYLAELASLPPARRGLVHARIREAAGRHAGVVAALCPSLAQVLGVEEPESDTADRFLVALSGFVSTLARASGGLLLVIDDLQWVDPDTAVVIRSLAEEAVTGTPIMLLGTIQDDLPAAVATADAALQPWGASLALDITLPPLGASAIGTLVASALPRLVADPRLLRRVTQRAGGNPFLALEYVRALVDAGLLRPTWGRWVLDEAGLEALELPVDALGLVLTRVGMLGEDVRGFLVTAAALGTSFRVSEVAEVHAARPVEVLRALAEAAGHGLIEARGSGRFAFLHNRIRDALHAELGPEEARDLHSRIAYALEGMGETDPGHRYEHVYAVAHHYMLGSDSANEPELVFAACLAAGEAALDEGAAARAIAFLDHAAAKVPPVLGVATHVRFLMTLGRAEKANGRYGDACRHFEEALGIELDPLARGALLGLVADARAATWRCGAAVEAAEQGLVEISGADGNERGRMRVALRLHEVALRAGLLDDDHEAVERHERLATGLLARFGHGAEHARCQALIGHARALAGDPAGSAAAFAQALADPAAASDPEVAAIVAYHRAAAAYDTFDDDGQALAALLDDVGPELEVPVFCEAVARLALDACWRGRLAEAEKWLAVGRRRLAVRGAEVTALAFVEPMLHALAGRPREAVLGMAAARKPLTGTEGAGLRALHMVARLVILVEQDDLGPVLDRVLMGVTAPGPRTPRHLLPSARTVADARLRRCRDALTGTGERNVDTLLAAAREAVRSVRAAAADLAHRRPSAADPLLTWAGAVVAADLLVLEDDPLAALAVLDGLGPMATPDSPAMAYEALRVRSRALAARGAVADARRHASFAALVADENGWPHRAAWARREAGERPQGHRPTGTGTIVEGTVLTGTAHASRDSVASPIPVGRLVERERLAALEQVSSAASRVLDPDELTRIALDQTVRILGAQRAILFLADSDGVARPHLGRDESGHDIGAIEGYSSTLVARVQRSREPLVVTGTTEAGALGSESAVRHDLRSILIAPLRIENRVLGVVYLDSRLAKGIFTTADAGILTAMTNHIATSLETARAAQLEISLQTAQRQRDLADQLRHAQEAMAAAVEPGEVLARLVEHAGLIVPSDSAFVLVPDAGADPALSAVLRGDGPLWGTVAEAPAGLAVGLPPDGAWLAVPLAAGTPRLLVMHSADPGAAFDEYVEVASALAAQAVTAFDKASLFAQVQALAVRDELTGLANRRHFFEVAERDVAAAVRAGRPMAAMMVDIDHFKRVNDTHGHPTGDDVIREVARRLSEATRTTDLVGRYGGEEFAVLLLDTGAEQLTEVDLGERLRGAVDGSPVETRSGPLAVTVSIGLTHLRPGDASVGDLLARADEGLYRAKTQGRNRVVIA